MMNRNLDALQLSGIRAYTNLAKEVDDCVLLTLGEPDFDTPKAICDAACQALAEGKTHYAPNQGLLELRQAIAEKETDRGNACTEENVLITAGATGAIFTAMLGVLNPGDEVILPMPAFPLYASIAAIAGAKIVPYVAEDFQITEESLSALITEKTKAIILNSPNNPTGSFLTADSLRAVKNAILGRDIYVIWDCVYQELSPENLPDLSLDQELKPQVLVCQSFSKPYAMTGWRVGYLVAPREMMKKFLLLHAAQVAAIPTFLQTACLTALKTDISSMVETYEERRRYVCERLTKMGLSYPEPKGAFYVFPNISQFGLEDSQFCRRLILEKKVATVPGSCFGAPGYLRISYACSLENLKTGLDRLEAFIGELKNEK